MTGQRRLSICYAVPGHCLLATSGPTRNVLSVAQALGRWADVTVAFRHVIDRDAAEGCTVLEIEGPARNGAAPGDDAALRGIGYGEFVRYMLALRRFARERLRDYDIVLEKSWLLSGYLSSLCRGAGVLGVPVENLVPDSRYAARSSLSKLLRIEVGRRLAGHFLRQAPIIVAETETLKSAITTHWGVAPDHVEVVSLGVDRDLFRPMDQAEARRRLDLDSGKTVLLYVGRLDATHDLRPVLGALARLDDPDLELHIVGEGPMRSEYQGLAAGCGAAVRFHGRVPHEAVPVHIAAADLCLAPYAPSAFASGEFGYSSMKVPEYLSVGRPVVGIPSPRMRELVEDGASGFLFGNETERWTRFLERRPSRDRLRQMGEAAARTPLIGWEDTARAVLSLCERQLAARNRAGRP